MNNTKTCNKCKTEKEISEFYKRPDRKSRLSSRCKVCLLEYSKLQRELHPEKRKAIVNKYCLNNKEKIARRDAIYYSKHQEKYKIRHIKWVKNNPKKVLIAKKKYYEMYPEKLTDRKKFQELVSPIIFNRDNYTCCLCNTNSGPLNAHHISSWAKDIENRFNEQNIITLCKDCHCKAHNNGKYKTINEDIKLQLQIIIRKKYAININIIGMK